QCCGGKIAEQFLHFPVPPRESSSVVKNQREPDITKSGPTMPTQKRPAYSFALYSISRAKTIANLGMYSLGNHAARPASAQTPTDQEPAGSNTSPVLNED